MMTRSKALVSALSFLALAAANAAHADVKLFREGKAITIIKEVGSDSNGILRPSNRFNRGTAAKAVVDFIAQQRAQFGLKKVDGEILELRGVHQDEKGASLRFIQRFNRVGIEGAEIVALIDEQGALTALNSSLVPTPKITVQPQITREQAQTAAIQGYLDAELGDGHGDGLRINAAGRLVWQFSLRERGDGSHAAQIQVSAQGANAGQIIKTISLAHDAEKGTINIYDASVSIVTPNPIFKGVKVLENGQETFAGRIHLAAEAKAANANLEATRDFYDHVFGRTSWDGKAAIIDASINAQKVTLIDVLGQKQNAAWMGPWKMFVFGAGGRDLGDFASALDVVGHEYTHAVISTTSNLEYEGQSGALNEHFADVFGAMIEAKIKNPAHPFLIGDSILRGETKRKASALRDMLNPEKGLSPQPVDMKGIPEKFGPGCKAAMDNDNCGVHILSGIPNRAVALTVQEVGWDALAPVYFRVMTARLRSNSKFADYRDQMLEECGASLPTRACDAMKTAFQTVGFY